MKTRFTAVLALMLSLTAGPLAGCPDDPTPGQPDVIADAQPDVQPDVQPDTEPDVGPVSCEPVDFQWPPAETITLAPHESWKTSIDFPYDSFLASQALDFGPWVKFTIFVGDPTRVVFQNSNTYPLHYEFASERLAPFQGMTPAEFDAATLHADGQVAILGAVLMAPWGERPEYGVQLVGEDPYPAEMVAEVMAIVDDAIESDAELTGYYMPTYEQTRVTTECADRFAALGVAVSGPERWGAGPPCYSNGWTVGRLVETTGATIDADFEAGVITTDDIALIDAVPAEVPPVAGIVSLTPSTPNSHVAILASTYGSPFVHLPREDEQAAAKALVGRTVVLGTRASYPGGPCQVDLFAVDELDATLLAELEALEDPGPIGYPAKASYGAFTADVEDLGPEDITVVGGKAANYGVLRDVIPSNSRPAIALTMDLWDAFLAQSLPSGGTLAELIDARLSLHSWPPNIASLAADLKVIRDAIEDETTFTAAQKTEIEAALGIFDPNENIRFRSSTNVEDSATFSGAGLYESKSGCLADDTDGDDAGPSICDPAETKERGVYRAIRKVYASFYGLHPVLERLRHGVDESEVGMGVLVHHSFPDPTELANGVGLTDHREGSSASFALSTQKGAVSVANPEPGTRPELAIVNLYGTFESVNVFETSSLLPLGATILDDPDEYVALAKLLNSVRKVFVAANGGQRTILDFEYKKIVDEGLVVKQVRELPPPDDEPSVTPLLIDQTTRLCTFQGEEADIFSNHRLKSRWTMNADSKWLTEAALDATFYSALSIEFAAGGELQQLDGDPATFAGFAHGKGADTYQAWVTDAFDVPSAGGSMSLRTAFQPLLPPSQAPAVRLGALQEWRVMSTWDQPKLTAGWEGPLGTQTTTEDQIRLLACTEDEEITPAHLLQERTPTATDGTALTIRFYWPPPPTGAVAGYTAPLVKWVDTTITGLTTEPIVLTNWFAQTYRPEHHNFAEKFLFEPRLDPGVSASTLAELEAQGIVMIYVAATPWDAGGLATVYYIGEDGSVFGPGEPPAP